MGGQRRRGAVRSLSCPPFAIASAALWSSACPRTSMMSGVCEGLGEGEGSAASAEQVGCARASLKMRGGSHLGTVAGQKWTRSQMPQCPLQNAPASRAWLSTSLTSTPSAPSASSCSSLGTSCLSAALCISVGYGGWPMYSGLSSRSGIVSLSLATSSSCLRLAAPTCVRKETGPEKVVAASFGQVRDTKGRGPRQKKVEGGFVISDDKRQTVLKTASHGRRAPCTPLSLSPSLSRAE